MPSCRLSRPQGLCVKRGVNVGRQGAGDGRLKTRDLWEICFMDVALAQIVIVCRRRRFNAASRRRRHRVSAMDESGRLEMQCLVRGWPAAEGGAGIWRRQGRQTLASIKKRPLSPVARVKKSSHNNGDLEIWGYGNRLDQPATGPRQRAAMCPRENHDDSANKRSTSFDGRVPGDP